MAEESGRPNSIGLNRRDLEAFCDELESGPHPSAAAAKRRHKRRAMRIPRLPIQVRHPGGHTTTLVVACRDLSSSGVGILHSSYLHVGTACSVYLPLRNGKHKRVDGHIRRCQHRRGVVHDVGVEFDESIDLREVMNLDLSSDWYSLEHVDPEALKGNVLYVEDSEVDRRLLRHHLRDTNLGVVCAESGEEAMSKIDADVNLVIVSYNLPDIEGPDLVEAMRNAGVRAPVIMLSVENSEVIRYKTASSGANAAIPKPVDADLLLRAIAEFFHVDDAMSSVGSSDLHSDHPNAALIPEFLVELVSVADRLEQAAEAGDVGALGRECVRLMGSAPALGFGRIGEQAGIIRRALNAKDKKMAAAEAYKLVALCRSAETRRAG